MVLHSPIFLTGYCSWQVRQTKIRRGCSVKEGETGILKIGIPSCIYTWVFLIASRTKKKFKSYFWVASFMWCRLLRLQRNLSRDNCGRTAPHFWVPLKWMAFDIHVVWFVILPEHFKIVGRIAAIPPVISKCSGKMSNRTLPIKFKTPWCKCSLKQTKSVYPSIYLTNRNFHCWVLRTTEEHNGNY